MRHRPPAARSSRTSPRPSQEPSPKRLGLVARDRGRAPGAGGGRRSIPQRESPRGKLPTAPQRPSASDARGPEASLAGQADLEGGLRLELTFDRSRLKGVHDFLEDHLLADAAMIERFGIVSA